MAKKKKTGNRKDNKSTKAEVNRRIHTVIKLVCQRLDRGDIIRYITEKTDWGVSERQIDNYLAEAAERIKKQRAYNRDMEFGKLVSALDELYVLAKRKKDYRTCRAIINDLSEIMGLKEYQPNNIKINQVTANINSGENKYDEVDEETLVEEWELRNLNKS